MVGHGDGEHGLDLVVVGRAHDGVGGVGEVAGAGAQQVGGRLAPGAQAPVLVAEQDVLGADRGPQVARAPPSGSDGGGRRRGGRGRRVAGAEREVDQGAGGLGGSGARRGGVAPALGVHLGLADRCRGGSHVLQCDTCRHFVTTRPDEPRTGRDLYLDAARECILDVGWRRTTLTEVARRAEVSRMTIYRTWADMPTLLGRPDDPRVGRACSTRSPAPRTEQADPVAVLRADLVAMVRALRGNELFVRIVELDPELVLPYLLARRGRSQDAILAVVEDVVRAGQAAGAVRRGEPTAIARALVLAAHGFVISAQTMVDDRVSEDDLDAELGRVVEGLLRP